MARRRPAILVTGAPRSGTTFLGRMLALPREVLYVDEPLNHETGFEGAERSFVYLGEGAPLEPRYAALVESLLEGRARYRAGAFRRPTRNPLVLLARALLGSRANLRYRLGSRLPWTKRYLIKDPTAALASEYLHRRFGMQTVVLLRHPAATVASYKRLGWRYNVREIFGQEEMPGRVDLPRPDELSPVEEWSLLWLHLYRVLTGYAERNPAMILVRHEDVSLQPQAEIRILYERLGLPYGGGVERAVAEHTSAHNPTDPPGGAEHHLKRNSAANVDRWRKLLSPGEVERIRAITSPVADLHYGDEEW